MSEMFNRLGRLARSVISDFTREPDADFQDAWSELDSFLGTENHSFPGDDGRRQSNDSTGNRAWQEELRRKQAEGLARDYANLELKPGAAEEDVRKSYKRLLIKYHPDKFAGSPEKQAIATEVTTKLNESYKRIIEILKAGG